METVSSTLKNYSNLEEKLPLATLNISDPGAASGRAEPMHSREETRKSSESSIKRFSFPIKLEALSEETTTDLPSKPPARNRRRPDSAEKHASMPSGLAIFETDDPFELRSNSITKLPLDENAREISFADALDAYFDEPQQKTQRRRSAKKSQDSVQDLAAFLKETGPEDFLDQAEQQEQKPGKSSFRSKLPRRLLKSKLFSPGEPGSSQETEQNVSYTDGKIDPLPLKDYSFSENYGPKNAARRISVSSYDSFLYTATDDGKLRLKDSEFAPKPILKNFPEEIPTRERSRSMGEITYTGEKLVDKRIVHLISDSLRSSLGGDGVSSQESLMKISSNPGSGGLRRLKRVKFVVPSSKDVHYFLDSDAGKAARRTYSLQPAFERDFPIPTPRELDPSIKRQFLHETFIDSEQFQVTTVYKPGMRPTGEYYKGRPLFYVLGPLGTFFLPEDSSESDDFGFNASSDED